MNERDILRMKAQETGDPCVSASDLVLRAVAAMGPLKIGDGTAPAGWPAYGATYGRGGGVIGVRCNFQNCGHAGSLGSPAKMECKGKDCECSCCQFLAGKEVHGLSYGARRS